MNKTQVVILLIGMVFAGLCLILIMLGFNITYAYEHGSTNATSTWTFIQVSCPAPIDSCDKGTTQIGQAICDDCNSYSTNRWIWFGIWEAMILIGTGIGIYGTRETESST